jgi:hypothetical protein
VNNEGIVYLLRKTSLTRSEIGKLTPPQFNEILSEVYFQESVDEWRRQHSIASIMAAIYNTIPKKRGTKACKASDFLAGEVPTRNPKADTLETLAEKQGIRLPTKELKER